jgi:hypothetical protein
MKSYKIRFIVDSKAGNYFDLESNEKPVKGELFTIEEANGKLLNIKITEVTKFVIVKSEHEAEIEYRCGVEEYKEQGRSIGFYKD